MVEALVRIRVHPELFKCEQRVLGVEQAKRNTLTETRGEDSNANVDGAAAGLKGNPAILRQSPFSDIQPRHHLDPADEWRREFARRRQNFDKVAVDPVTDRQFVFERIDVNVGGSPLHGFVDQTIDKPDHGSVIGSAKQVRRFRYVVDQAFKTATARHGGFNVRLSHGALAESQCQFTVEYRFVHRFQRVRTAERTPGFNQCLCTCTVPDANRQHGPIGQHDQALVLGECVSELANRHEYYLRPI